MLYLAVITGDRVKGTAHAKSDRYIAIQWLPHLNWLSVHGHTTALRSQIATTLDVSPTEVDLIELRRAHMAKLATVTEKGLPLCGKIASCEWTFCSVPDAICNMLRQY